MRDSQHLLELIKLNFGYIAKEYLDRVQAHKLPDSKDEPEWRYLNIKHIQKVKNYISLAVSGGESEKQPDSGGNYQGIGGIGLVGAFLILLI